MLELAGVSVNDRSVRALSDINLRVGPGEIVALSGEPGAGKSALVHCIAGDLSLSEGQVLVAGQPLSGGLREAERRGVAFVWQDLALCEHMDVADNLMLGHESGQESAMPTRFHAHAREILRRLDLPIGETTQLVSRLRGGQRRHLALAMALSREPKLLVLDEPTVDLGVADAAAVERLLVKVRREGVSVLLATRDIGQMFRIADRIVVLRGGRIVTELAPEDSYPDEVAALLAGGSTDGSARRQLARLHGLADSLARAEPSSGLALILSSLAAALAVDRERVSILEPDQMSPTVAGARVGEVKVQDRVWLVPVRPATNRPNGEPLPAGAASAIVVERDDDLLPSRDEHDLLVLYAGYAASAIERLEAERAQREALAARRSQELQQQFLSRLSHELRTPLTAIRGYATSLASPDVVWDHESEQRFLERIGVESERLGRLVDDLLDFSAIEAGVMRLQFDWCDLPLIVEAAVDCLPAKFAGQVTVSGEAPVIWADHDRLEQVFVNLTSNALGHNPPGTTVEITLRAPDEREVEVMVSDDGPGLPEPLREAPFQQQAGHAHSLTAGAGLGLSITHGIIEAHGGRIYLEPTSRGTTFRIVLPIDAKLAEDA